MLGGHWLQLASPVGFFVGTEVPETQSHEGIVKRMNEVILASLGRDTAEAAVAECLSYDTEFESALLGDFSIDYAVDGNLDVVRWLSMHMDFDSRKILVPVAGGSYRRALASLCLRWRGRTPGGGPCESMGVVGLRVHVFPIQYLQILLRKLVPEGRVFLLVGFNFVIF